MTQQLDGALKVSTTGWNRPEWLFVLAPAALLAGVVGIWLLLLASVAISELMKG